MKASAAPLPAFITPMLAKPGEPFDSDEYLFEVKWDGTRALCFIESGTYRLVNRRRIDMTDRYPEFAFLAGLDAGTVLDGEMIVLKDGKPEFSSLQSREQARTPLKIRTLAQAIPATYAVFDLLYSRGKCIMDQPLDVRRRLLGKKLKKWAQPRLLFSKAVIGKGKAFMQEVVSQGLEGVVAKRLTSKYLPGQRMEAWIKIKRGMELYCLVIGYLPSGKDDFRSLILAIEENGQLRVVGKVGTGFDMALRRRINQWLQSHARNKPIIPCAEKGKWVEPGMICRVSCMERSPRGELRAPVFEELVRE